MDRHPFHPNQVGPADQYFVTSHDGESLLQLFKSLAGKFQQFLSGISKGAIPAQDIAKSPARFMEAMLATLFLRPQHQQGIKQEAFAYFQDLHGYGHQLNGSLMFNNFHQPGHPNNWRLRILPDYKGEWESRIQNNEIPSPAAVWKTALQAKGQGQSATAKTLQDLDTIFKIK
jgi:hypothetical protein